jgi:hypothetical protein
VRKREKETLPNHNKKEESRAQKRRAGKLYSLKRRSQRFKKKKGRGH